MSTKPSQPYKNGLCRKSILYLLVLALIPAASATILNSTIISEDGNITNLVYDNTANAYIDRATENPNVLITACATSQEDLLNKFIRATIMIGNTTFDLTSVPGQILTIGADNCTSVDVDFNAFQSLYPGLITVKITNDSTSFENVTGSIELNQTTGGLLNGSYNITFTPTNGDFLVTVTDVFDDKGNAITIDKNRLIIAIKDNNSTIIDSAITSPDDTVTLSSGGLSFTAGDFQFIVNGLVAGALETAAPSAGAAAPKLGGGSAGGRKEAAAEAAAQEKAEVIPTPKPEIEVPPTEEVPSPACKPIDPSQFAGTAIQCACALEGNTHVLAGSPPLIPKDHLVPPIKFSCNNQTLDMTLTMNGKWGYVYRCRGGKCIKINARYGRATYCPNAAPGPYARFVMAECSSADEIIITKSTLQELLMKTREGIKDSWLLPAGLLLTLILLLMLYLKRKKKPPKKHIFIATGLLFIGIAMALTPGGITANVAGSTFETSLGILVILTAMLVLSAVTRNHAKSKKK